MTTSLCSEFLLQVKKQWEDSAMILARTVHQMMKNADRNTKEKDKAHKEERTEYMKCTIEPLPQ